MSVDAARPHVVAHLAVALDGSSRGFVPDLGEFYELAATWGEDVTLAGADTILAQEPALRAAPPGPGPKSDGPLLAVVDSRSRVSTWAQLRDAGHWRDAVPLTADHPGERVDLAAALCRMAAEGAKVVRVDSGGVLVGALLAQDLIDEVSLLVHPCLGDGRPWTDAPTGLATRFVLARVERRGEGLVWLRYEVRPDGGVEPPQRGRDPQ